MSERFDVLFEGMPEEKALMYLRADPEKLDNPSTNIWLPPNWQHATANAHWTA